MSRRGIGRRTRLLKAQLRKSNGLPFGEFFTEERVAQLLDALEISFRDRVFTPVITLLTFVAQTLIDRCCRAAVSRVIATRIAERKKAPSQNTGAYCEARQRLPEAFFAGMLGQTCAALRAEEEEQSWLGRHRVIAVDGSSAQGQDTPENRKYWGLPSGVTPGCGFPVVPFVGFFSLATGMLVRLVIGKKGSHERRLFRMGWDVFRAGDVCLGDRGFCAYADMAMLLGRGVHSVFRLFNRKPNFRMGRQLGKEDHLTVWERPKTQPRGLTKREWLRLPERMEVREIRIRVNIKGFRSQELVLVTTLFDASFYTKEELAALYLRRWQAELNFRHIKTTLGMELLSTMKPETVRKELHTYMIGYNMIRVLMWQAGERSEVDALRLSFAGAVQHLASMSPHLGRSPSAREHLRLYHALLDLIAGEYLPDRPNRVEPRVRKRRPKNYPLMTKPRSVLKAALMGKS